MPRVRLSVASSLALLALAAPARAADPVLPLSEVRAGMRCTSLSVVRGLEPVPFDVEIIDVVEGDPASDGPRILMRVSGDAVDETGIGPGFSGSPIYCPDARGVPANAGALAESVGEYGGKVALATPIESILGNPPEPPAQTVRRPASARRTRSLAGPLTISGLGRPLALGLTRAAARRGRALLAAPSGPLGRFPPQQLRPGSAMGVGYSSGDITIGAVGTVAYTDQDRVWGFGHELDAAGRRNLLLQDAYVYRVVNNPNTGGDAGSTYKLAAASHDVGSLTNDALSAVVGRFGARPATIPIRVTVRDEDTGARRSVDVDAADETDVEDPLGIPIVSLVAPLAVTQAAGGILKSVPAKTSGDMCVDIAVREIPKGPLRFCNRYVGEFGGGGGDFGLGNIVASGAGADLDVALSLIGAYADRPLHVTSVRAGIRIHRGSDLVYMRSLDLPRRVRAGRTVMARIVTQRLRGEKRTIRVPIRMPPDLERGSRRIILRGAEADLPGEGFFDELIIGLEGEEDEAGSRSGDESALDFGPQSLGTLRRAVERLGRYDGVKLFVGRARGRGREAYRDPEVRLAGRVSARVRVTR